LPPPGRKSLERPHPILLLRENGMRVADRVNEFLRSVRVEALRPLAAEPFGEAIQQLLPAGEVSVHRTMRDTCDVGDLLDGNIVDPFIKNQSSQSLKNEITCEFRMLITKSCW